MTEVISAKRAQTRQRLLDAAFRVLAEEGLAAASIEAIVARAGFTRGAFYSNFSTKEELFAAVVEREMRRRLDAALEAVGKLDRTQVPEPLTAQFISSLLQQVITDPETEREWQIIMTEIELASLRQPAQVPGLAHLDLLFMEEVAGALLPALQALGIQLRGDPEVALRVLINGYLSTARQSLRGAGEESVEQFTVLVEKFLRPAPISS